MKSSVTERKHKVIVGLGETGLSLARHLAARGDGFVVMDDNPEPSRVARLGRIAPHALVQPIDGNGLIAATEILRVAVL